MRRASLIFWIPGLLLRLPHGPYEADLCHRESVSTFAVYTLLLTISLLLAKTLVSCWYRNRIRLGSLLCDVMRSRRASEYLATRICRRKRACLPCAEVDTWMELLSIALDCCACHYYIMASWSYLLILAFKYISLVYIYLETNQYLTFLYVPSLDLDIMQIDACKADCHHDVHMAHDALYACAHWKTMIAFFTDFSSSNNGRNSWWPFGMSCSRVSFGPSIYFFAFVCWARCVETAVHRGHIQALSQSGYGKFSAAHRPGCLERCWRSTLIWNDVAPQL